MIWCAADLPGQTPPPAPLDPCVGGSWDQKFKHKITATVGAPKNTPFSNPPTFDPNFPNKKFNALHMALIPQGPNQGNVIVWDLHYPAQNKPPAATQRWSVVDPINEDMWNYDLPMPTTGPGATGDLFCVGHVWTKNGNLFVAGGTEQYPQNGGYLGGRLTYVWDPVIGGNTGWKQLPDLQKNRWYPTITVDHNDTLIVFGGLNHQSGANNINNQDYEAFGLTAPKTGQWHKDANNVRIYQGPDPQQASPFSVYPRCHLLSTGEVFISGHGPDSARILHDPLRTQRTGTLAQLWKYDAGNQPTGVQRHDGSSVLFPIELDPKLGGVQKDLVYRMGGMGGPQAPLVHNSVEACQGATASAPWTYAMSMAFPRLDLNTVILPDGTILAIGGNDVVGGNPQIIKTPELYKGGQWIKMNDHDSPRQYHSTAMLLPSGKVLVGGGDYRTWDYEVFSPPYLFCGDRPQITGLHQSGVPTTTLQYGKTYTVTFAPLPTTPPTYVERVVLMRPGSVTHASCMDQRYLSLELELPLDPAPNWRNFKTPAPSSNVAPKGFYMLFLVNNLGVPSVATWVKIQS